MLTYEEALKITENSEAFYVSRGKIQGFEYAMFSYRLAQYEDFIKYNALEMRGLTFVYNGVEWVRHLMLTKFFNLNENKGNLYKDFKDKKIKSIQDKKDGSLISFLTLPNGNVVPRTKMGIDNDQVKWVKQLLDKNDKEYFYNKIKSFKSQGVTFLFEFTAPKNRIVIKHTEPSLTLLQGRREDGLYLNKAELESSSRMLKIPLVQYEELASLETLIKRRETEIDKEGWCVTYEDGTIQKIKTEWYVAEHRLRESLQRENDIIKLTLDEEIDDLLSELEGDEKTELQAQVTLIDHYYNHRVFKALNLRVKYYQDYKEDRKAFAIDNCKVQDFGVVMKNLIGIKIPGVIKERMIQENKGLETARNFLEKLATDKQAEDCLVGMACGFGK